MNSNSLSRSESGTSQTHYEDITNAPSPKVLMDGYTREGLDWDRPRATPANARRTGSVTDAVTMHFLVESAVGESSQFDVLSVEELDQLRKEEAAVLRRTAGLRRELQLERRVRDAARSLSRLSDGKSAAPGTGKGRGFEGLSQNDYGTSAQKCDDMSYELWDLERRQSDLREKRLQHTAGVLQMQYEQQKSHTDFGQVNGWHDTDDWADGFSLRRVAPGSLADTADGIMDIPGLTSRKTDTMLNELWRLLDPQASSTTNGERSLQLDGANGMNEEFSHEAFQDRVLHVCTRAASLENQLNQERAMRSQNESDKSVERSQLVEQLQDAHDQHLASQKKFQDAQADLMETRGQLDQTKQEISYLRQQHEYERAADVNAEREAKMASESELLSHLEARDQQLSSLEQTHRELDESHRAAQEQLQNQERAIKTLQSSDSSSTARVGELQAQHNAAQTKIEQLGATVEAAEVRVQRLEETAQQHEQRANQSSKRVSDMEAERQDLEAEVVRLQTEVTVARAELDGAYGTRAQRAAEVADNPEIRKKLDELSLEKDAATKRIDVLQNELHDLVTEHEALVRQGVEAEREREHMESQLDSLREKAEGLEVKLTEERVRKMGRRASGASNGPSTPGTAVGRGEVEPTSMSVMRNEFKKMMREARAEHFRGLRVSLPPQSFNVVHHERS